MLSTLSDYWKQRTNSEQILVSVNQEVQEHHTDLIEHLNKRLEAVEGERDKLKESLKILEELKEWKNY